MSSEVVVVRVAGRAYAVPTVRVREVAHLVALTPVPTAPPRVAGLTQLRGQILPVLDLIADGVRTLKPNDPLLVVELGPVRAAIAVDSIEGVQAAGEGAIAIDVGALFDELRAGAT
jgi:purine-binding chemotaxis protein CheW